jgi:hypothetical protein
MVGAMYIGAAVAAWLPVRRAAQVAYEASNTAAD